MRFGGGNRRVSDGGEPSPIAEMSCQIAACNFAQMPDAQPEQDAGQTLRSCRLDPRKQVRCRYFAPAFKVRDSLEPAAMPRLQDKNIGRSAYPTQIVEALDLLVTQTVDIHRTARHEMLESRHPLRRTDQSTGASPYRLPRIALRRAAAFGADFGKYEWHRIRRTC